MNINLSNLKPIFKKIGKHKTEVLTILLIFSYLYLIWYNFFNYLNTISVIFGYFDYHNNWRALDDFIQLKVPFKDYYYEYGWFFLLIQSIPYVLFGKTFLALLISRHIFLPLVGVFLSIIIGKILLKKIPLLLLFLFFLLLFRVNFDYVSVRHLVAELSLAFFALFLWKNKKKFLISAGITAGLSLLTALEYGLALHITYLIIFFIIILQPIIANKKNLLYFFIAECFILIPYTGWLLINHALFDYIKFTVSVANNFYYANPCSGDSFPRLYELTNLYYTHSIMSADFLLGYLRRLNFYLVPIFYLFTFLFLLFKFFQRKKVTKNLLVVFSLFIYGSLIFIRTLDCPCTGYFTYGLVPFFLLICYLIDHNSLLNLSSHLRKKSFIIISLIVILLFWFIVTEENGILIFIIKDKQGNNIVKKQLEYYTPAGWFLDKILVHDYREITSYIEKNTAADDYLYVFPWGPYNMITRRKNPTALTNAIQADLGGPTYFLKLLNDLKQNQPSLLIVNIYNSLSTARFGLKRDDIEYIALPGEEGPVFAGRGNIIDTYILSNYRTVFHNDVAVIMEKRPVPAKNLINKPRVRIFPPEGSNQITLKSAEKTKKNGVYKINSKYAEWSINFKDQKIGTGVFLDLMLDGDIITKHFTRYYLNVTVSYLVNKEHKIARKSVLATKDWQEIFLNLENPGKVTGIAINIGLSKGFLWFFPPYRLSIRNISFQE